MKRNVLDWHDGVVEDPKMKLNCELCSNLDVKYEYMIICFSSN